jgi:pimeloyl-ACP methyl ester carboxylesterase
MDVVRRSERLRTPSSTRTAVRTGLIALCLTWMAACAPSSPPPSPAAPSPPAPAAATTAPTPPWQTLPVPDASQLIPTTTGHVEVDGARLYYASYGSGAPVLLLHGGLGSGDDWALQIPALTAAGHRVIALDSRGHGRSTRGPGAMHYQRMADDVIAVLDHLHIERTALIGWSDGGIIGLDLAIRHPGRLSRLVAFAANARTDGIRLDGPANAVGDAYAEKAANDYRKRSPTPGDYRAFLAAMDAMWTSEPDYSDLQLATIRTPTLIAAGEHDEYIRADHTRAIAAAIPGAQLVVLPGMSHFGLWQAPDAFNRVVVDFLAD